MTEQIKQWFKDQTYITTIAITVMVAIIGVLMTGFWMSVASIRDEVVKLRGDVSTVKETLPSNYVGLVEYLRKEAIIRVHDEANQSLLSGMQTQMALTNERLGALIESMKSYRQEYREDNPYVNERGPAYNNKKAGIEQRRGEQKKGSNK
jgi:acyl carrier protein phosphodiesterase